MRSAPTGIFAFERALSEDLGEMSDEDIRSDQAGLAEINRHGGGDGRPIAPTFARPSAPPPGRPVAPPSMKPVAPSSGTDYNAQSTSHQQPFRQQNIGRPCTQTQQRQLAEAAAANSSHKVYTPPFHSQQQYLLPPNFPASRLPADPQQSQQRQLAEAVAANPSHNTRSATSKARQDQTTLQSQKRPHDSVDTLQQQQPARKVTSGQQVTKSRRVRYQILEPRSPEVPTAGLTQDSYDDEGDEAGEVLNNKQPAPAGRSFARAHADLAAEMRASYDTEDGAAYDKTYSDPFGDNKENQQLQAALLQSNTAILEQLRELRQENAHLSQQMTNLQQQKSRKADCGLLERTERTAALHPLLIHSFRKAAYPADQEYVKLCLKYAGVPHLLAFKKRYAPDFRGRAMAQPPILTQLKSKARIQMKNNIRFGAAKAIRTEAGLSYQRLIDRSCNMPNPWTTEILLKGTAFRDEPNGLCDMPPFVACVKAYQRWLDPDADLQLGHICLTLNEVAFITNEVEKELSGRKGNKHTSKNKQNQEDRDAVAIYEQELEELTGCEDSIQPPFQLVDISQIAEPDIGVLQEDEGDTVDA